jgi:hypothetical protein
LIENTLPGEKIVHWSPGSVFFIIAVEYYF